MNYTAKYVIFFAANISQVQTQIIAWRFFLSHFIRDCNLIITEIEL
jgi:hypothetical protein